jgi:flagellar basal-body rod modification protein FlgD
MTTITPLANLPTTDTAATSSSTGSSKTATKGSAADTQNRFLTMLVAQLKNQDPLNPMDNSQITTQLAQISTVNGVESLNTTMKTMSTGLDSLQAVQAASLAGRQVMSSGNALELANGSATGGFQLDQAVDSLTVSVIDAAGAMVQRVDLGAQPAGVHTFQWDGTTDAGGTSADGHYTFKLQGRAQNVAVTPDTLAVGRVDAVSRTTDGIVLSVGGVGDVGMADVKRIL